MTASAGVDTRRSSRSRRPVVACGGGAETVFQRERELFMPHPRRAVRNNNGSNGSRVAEGPATDGHGPSARLRRAPRFQLELLLKDFAHFVDSDVALLYQVEGPGQTPTVSCSWGLGGPPQHIARPVEGGVVGRALERPARRAALGPLDPMFDSSLMEMSEPPLQFAVTANVRSASGAHGVLIAGFCDPAPRGRADAVERRVLRRGDRPLPRRPGCPSRTRRRRARATC